jgi:hypothetical protein
MEVDAEASWRKSMLLTSQGHSYAAAGGKVCHAPRMVNRSISLCPLLRPVYLPDPTEVTACRSRRAGSIGWRLRRLGRSSLPVSACNKAATPPPAVRRWPAAARARLDGFGSGGPAGRARRAGPPRGIFLYPGCGRSRGQLRPPARMLRYAATGHMRHQGRPAGRREYVDAQRAS